MTRGSVASGRARLAVEVSGDETAPPIAFLHAGVTDRRSWQPLVDHLGGGVRAVRHDARGYGETAYEPETGWSPVADAIAVLDALAIDRTIVIGCSMGGRTALDLTLEHPERVSALVVIGSAIGGAPRPHLDEPTAVLDAQIQAAERRGDLDEVNRLEAELWLDGPGHAGRAADLPRELFAAMNGRALRAPDPGTTESREDAWSRLGEVTAPTLVLVGQLDLVHVRRNARHIAESIADARLIELKAVAHLPHLEGDRETLDAIAEFVASRTT